MSSIVADELAKIKSFETDTEKRRSELTLNELNYISDKQLHKKASGGGELDFDVLVQVDLMTEIESEAITTIIGDYETFKEKFNQNNPKYTVGAIVQVGDITETAGFIANTVVNQETENEYINFILITEGDMDVAWHPDGTWSFVSDSQSDPQPDSHS